MDENGGSHLAPDADVEPERARPIISRREFLVGAGAGAAGEGLRPVPLRRFDGVLTGDSDVPVSVDTVRTAIASLRFETILL
jgi:hypothetical protein